MKRGRLIGVQNDHRINVDKSKKNPKNPLRRAIVLRMRTI